MVLLSDIGANTCCCSGHVQPIQGPPNRLAAIRDYVADGGGFIMVGGYLTFQGIDAKGQYAGSPAEERCPSRSCAAMTGSRRRKEPSRASSVPPIPSSPGCPRNGRPPGL